MMRKISDDFFMTNFDRPIFGSGIEHIGFGFYKEKLVKDGKLEFWLVSKSFGQERPGINSLILDVVFKKTGNEVDLIKINDLATKGNASYIFNTAILFLNLISSSESMVTGNLQMFGDLKRRVEFWQQFGFNINQACSPEFKMYALLGELSPTKHRETGTPYLSEINSFKNTKGQSFLQEFNLEHH